MVYETKRKVAIKRPKEVKRRGNLIEKHYFARRLSRFQYKFAKKLRAPEN
jgi:hypothetical protein